MNEEDPLKARLVDDAIDAARRRGEPAGLARAHATSNLQYLNLLLERRHRERARQRVHRARACAGSASDRGGAQAAAARLARSGATLDQVVRFNRLAQQNFGLVEQGADRDQRADPRRQAGRRAARACR